MTRNGEIALIAAQMVGPMATNYLLTERELNFHVRNAINLIKTAEELTGMAPSTRMYTKAGWDRD